MKSNSFSTGQSAGHSNPSTEQSERKETKMTLCHQVGHFTGYKTIANLKFCSCFSLKVVKDDKIFWNQI